MSQTYIQVSDSCKSLLRHMIGYRNDYCSTGHYNIKDVIDYEINELGNDDIIETCKNFYGTDDIYAVISRHFNTDNFNELWGLWLTTQDGVEKYYHGLEEGYSVYCIPENTLIISDLDDEGVLFVLDRHPRQYMHK